MPLFRIIRALVILSAIIGATIMFPIAYVNCHLDPHPAYFIAIIMAYICFVLNRILFFGVLYPWCNPPPLDRDRYQFCGLISSAAYVVTLAGAIIPAAAGTAAHFTSPGDSGYGDVGTTLIVFTVWIALHLLMDFIFTRYDWNTTKGNESGCWGNWWLPEPPGRDGRRGRRGRRSPHSGSAAGSRRPAARRRVHRLVLDERERLTRSDFFCGWLDFCYPTSRSASSSRTATPDSRYRSPLRDPPRSDHSGHTDDTALPRAPRAPIAPFDSETHRGGPVLTFTPFRRGRQDLLLATDNRVYELNRAFVYPQRMASRPDTTVDGDRVINLEYHWQEVLGEAYFLGNDGNVWIPFVERNDLIYVRQRAFVGSMWGITRRYNNGEVIEDGSAVYQVIHGDDILVIFNPVRRVPRNREFYGSDRRRYTLFNDHGRNRSYFETSD